MPPGALGGVTVPVGGETGVGTVGVIGGVVSVGRTGVTPAGEVGEPPGMETVAVGCGNVPVGLMVGVGTVVALT